ncbi:MAG: tRNA pseudouridine(55) synthase TruB [Salibacteraceae bacterium]
MKSFQFLEGETLLIDKPLTWTSFDVVNKLRYGIKRHLGVKKIKVGHAGTLDPLATGLVIICSGKNTKNIEQYMGLKKVYTGCITLGGTTPSYDLETEITLGINPEFTLEQIQEKANNFLGEIQQTPPIFSAKKIDGKKAYDLARAGKEVVMKKNPVEVNEFKILDAQKSKHIENGLDCNFTVTCSKGTYIRSLAFDLGESLGCGGFLSSLTRTQIGDLKVEDAISPEEFIDMLDDIPKSQG